MCVPAATRGVGVLDYQRTEDGVRIGIDGGVSLEEAGCRFCGACVEVCPTGSIVDVLGLNKPERSREDNVVPCRSGCPAHIDIPRYLRHVKAGEWEKATAVVREECRSRTLGSICTHNCAERRKSPAATSWSALHLQAQSEGCRRARHGRVEVACATSRLRSKRVAIVGAGPLASPRPYYLAEKGRTVTVFGPRTSGSQPASPRHRHRHCPTRFSM